MTNKSAPVHADGRDRLAGSLRILPADQVLALVNQGARTCKVTFHAGGLMKILWFRKGELVFAGSTAVGDRLGPALLRAGLIDLPGLVAAGALITAQRKLGQVLKDMGRLKPTDVYRGIVDQVRHIALTLFDAEEGDFQLVDGPIAPPSEVKLPGRTRDLLLEGLKRPLLRERYLALLPSRDSVLERVERPGAPSVPRERVVFSVINGERTVEQVMEASQVGDFDALAAVASLLEDVRVRAVRGSEKPVEKPARGPRPTAPEVAARARLEQSARRLQRIFEILKDETGVAQAILDGFLVDPPPALAHVFRGVAPDEHGRVDLEKLEANARAGTAPEKARAIALDALQQFVSFALFEAKDLLAPEIYSDLLADLGIDGESIDA